MSRSIFFLMGPTASGKTQLAIQLVQHFPFEIISVDSAMVYRGLDIGTAKPDANVLKQAPHRLLNIRDPAEPYSAADFRKDALREIEDIFSHQKIPLLVGGTMLYFKTLQTGLSELPSADAQLRMKLLNEGKELGWPALHERLQQIDPVAAKRIHPNDSQRIQRALEVYEISGKNLTTWQEQYPEILSPFKIHSMAIAPNDRSILHERIAQRFKNMLAAGFIDEVRSLFQRGDLSLEKPSIRSVGYRQVWEYLSGNLTYPQMEEKGIIATRQLAKRQLTWLRSWPDVKWFDSEAKNLCDQVVSYIKGSSTKMVNGTS